MWHRYKALCTEAVAGIVAAAEAAQDSVASECTHMPAEAMISLITSPSRTHLHAACCVPQAAISNQRESWELRTTCCLPTPAWHSEGDQASCKILDAHSCLNMPSLLIMHGALYLLREDRARGPAALRPTAAMCAQ